MKKNTDEFKDWKLSEMRELYPTIKAASREKFIAKIHLLEEKELEEQDTDEFIDATLNEDTLELDVTYEVVEPDEEEDVDEDEPPSETNPYYSTAEIKEREYEELVKNSVPDYLNDAIATDTGCKCWVDNQIYFHFAMTGVSAVIQDAIIRYLVEELGRKKLKRTSCPPCLKNRVTDVKNDLLTKFDIKTAI